ncbi:hypothetical protein PanWU01x14_121530, partial [Parasponia andersonii]
AGLEQRLDQNLPERVIDELRSESCKVINLSILSSWYLSYLVPDHCSQVLFYLCQIFDHVLIFGLVFFLYLVYHPLGVTENFNVLDL